MPKEPWEMTKEEWELARESIKPETRQGEFTRRSSSQEVARDKELNRLLYGVTQRAREQVTLAQKGDLELAPEELQVAIERLETPVRHRDVIKKALSEGKPVSAVVLRDYPDLKYVTLGAKTNRQKQAKVNAINEAIARSAYAKEKGVKAQLRKDGIIEYSRIYPERPESRMKISFMEMLNTLEGEDIRHLHKLYSTKEIVKLPKRKVPRITQKTPKLRR